MYGNRIYAQWFRESIKPALSNPNISSILRHKLHQPAWGSGWKVEEQEQGKKEENAL